MPSLDDHFGALTKVRPPESWPELGEGESGLPSPPPRRSRKLAPAVLAFLIAAAGSVLAIRAFPGQRAGPAVPATRQPVETSPSSPRAAPTPSSSPAGGMFGAMLEAIRGSSPPGWRFTLTGDRLEGDWRLDGDADDGAGPARLFIDVTLRPGMLEADPCADPEFRRGGRCVKRSLPNGDLLVLRGVIVEADGLKTIEVVLIHPDRSGVGAEAGNWTMATLPDGSAMSQGDLATPRVTRSDPLYTVEQLADVVLAVDEGTRACVRTNCG
jgi:hypothetical protein